MGSGIKRFRMQREDILCQINSERYDDPVDFPFRCGDERLHFPFWHLVTDNRQCAALPGRGIPFHSLGPADEIYGAHVSFDSIRLRYGPRC